MAQQFQMCTALLDDPVQFLALTSDGFQLPIAPMPLTSIGSYVLTHTRLK